LAVLTTQQILSFIQYKIAATHAAGEDICVLLTNPEIAFSLHVLESSYNNLTQAPVGVAAASNIDYRLAQHLAIVGAKKNDGSGQTLISLF
jgi:hypothetical protein